MARRTKYIAVAKKQPLEASSWQDLISTRISTDCNNVVAGNSNFVFEKKRKHLTTSADNDEIVGLAFDLEESDRIVHAVSNDNYDDEYEMTSKTFGRVCRSENRRIKRIQDRQMAKMCYNCRQAGHEIADCPEIRKDHDQGAGICFKCGSTEHRLEKCRTRTPNGELPFAKCFICGENGHLSKQCPDNPRGLYPYGGCCRICGSVEHYKKDCPEQRKKSKEIEEVKVSRLNNQESADIEIMAQPKPAVQLVKRPKIVKF